MFFMVFSESKLVLKNYIMFILKRFISLDFIIFSKTINREGKREIGL